MLAAFLICLGAVLLLALLLTFRGPRTKFIQAYIWFGGADLRDKPHVYYCGVIGVVCTVAGAALGILIFNLDVNKRSEDRQHQFAIDRKLASLKYVDRLADSKALSDARVTMDLFFVKPSIRQELAKIRVQDLPAAAETWIKNDPDLENAVWRMYDFYDGLAGCIQSSVCDSKVACDAFRDDLVNFAGTTRQYFESLIEIHYGTKYLKRIDSVLDRQCKSADNTD